MTVNPKLEQAVAILKRGGLVAFPTETVYGLGADANNPDAVKKIFEIKHRPQTHPVIVHIVSINEIELWARAIPAKAYQLAERFWPGPLTLVLKRAMTANDIVTGGQATIALRAPAHHIAQALLNRFGGGIAAPSANRYGHISPTTAQHVYQELGDQVELILDGGPCAVGIESTIVDLSGEIPRLLRPGWIPAEQISATIKQDLAFANEDSPRVPGSLPGHYAPNTPLMLVDATKLISLLRSELQKGKKIAVLACSEQSEMSEKIVRQIAPMSAASYAHKLYANLRDLDEKHCDLILVETPPNGADWEAIHDRLERAAFGHGVEDIG